MDNSAPKDPTAPVVGAPFAPGTPSPSAPSAPISPASLNAATSQKAIPTAPIVEPAGTPPKKSSKLLIIVLLLLIAAVIIVGAVYFLLLQKGSKTGSNNATGQAVQNSPTPAAPTAAPSPQSNAGLQQQDQAVTQDLNNLDTQVTQVNSALSDQAPNLQ